MASSSSRAVSGEQTMGASGLQREVDALQAGYTQEQRTLELLARECLGNAQRLFEESKSPGYRPASSQVVWCIENVCPVDAAAHDAEYCISRHFELPQCPGVFFCLVFHPFGGAIPRETLEGGLPPCRLALKVSGVAAEGLRLAVVATLDLESTALTPGDNRILSTEWDLFGAEQVNCYGHWPATGIPAAAELVCSAKLTVRSWEMEVLHLETQWPSAEDAAEFSSPVSGSDTTVHLKTLMRSSPQSPGNGSEVEEDDSDPCRQ